MPLINTSVSNLIQGVSQQPDPTRFSGQCEEQENALSSIIDGLSKRPNTRHIREILGTSIGENSFVHFVDRSNVEKYVILYNRTDHRLYVFDLITGNSRAIIPDADFDKRTANGHQIQINDYLRSINPRESLKAITIGDTSIITNSEQRVAANSSKSYSLDKDAMIFIKQGDYKKQYGFDIRAIVEEETTNYTQADGTVVSVPASSAKIRVPLSLRSETWVTSVDVWGIHRNKNIYIEDGGSGFSVDDRLTLPIPNRSIGGYSNSLSTYKVSGHLDLYLESAEGAGEGGDGAGPNDSAAVDSYGYGEFENRMILRVTDVVATTGAITGLEIASQGRYWGNNSFPSVYYDPIIASTNTFTSYTEEGATIETTTVEDVELRIQVKVESDDGIAASDDSTQTSPQDADSSVILAKFGTGDTGNRIITPTRVDSSGDTVNTFPEDSDGTATNFSDYFSLTETEVNQNLMVLTAKNTVKSFEVSGFDGLANSGIGVIYREVNSISDLPTYAKDNFKVKVRGDASVNEDDYYVKFETKGVAQYGQGSWVECVGPDVAVNFSSTSCPMELVSLPDGDFSLRTMKFADRKAGDDDSNPMPSFVNKAISNVFFFKNRLGFLCEDNIILSETGLGVTDIGYQDDPLGDQTEFNFTRKTVVTLLDDDPIDVAVSSSRVTTLRAAKAFQENLILFSDNGQFVLRGGDTLTAKTISVTPVTNFDFEKQVDPLPLGSYIYFPFTRGNFSGIREFTINSTTDVYDSTEITQQVPSYIPKNVIDMAGASSEGLLAVLSKDEPSSLFIYKYFWNNREKVLSSWSKFTFTGTIRGIHFIDSTLFMLIIVNGKTHLVELSAESGLIDPAGFVTHLDMRIERNNISGDSFGISGSYVPANNTVEVYKKDGTKLPCTNTGGTVKLNEALGSATSLWIGIPYTMKYTFSEQLFKAKAGNATTVSNAANLQVRNGSIYYDDTAAFKVKVTPKGRSTHEESFDAGISREDGFLRFPVFASAEDTVITIENDGALPSKFQSAEFESFVHSRSSRYG